MKYTVKFIKENIYTDAKKLPKKKKIPLSILTNKITMEIRGWKVDTDIYRIVPKSYKFKAILKNAPKDIKTLNDDELIDLFNKNVTYPFIPIIDFQQIIFYKDGKEMYKKNRKVVF